MNGDGTAQYNKGKKKEEDRDSLRGSIFEWEDDEAIYLGSTQGANIFYGNLGGEGRADMVGSQPDGTVCFPQPYFPPRRICPGLPSLPSSEASRD